MEGQLIVCDRRCLPVWPVYDNDDELSTQQQLPRPKLNTWARTRYWNMHQPLAGTITRCVAAAEPITTNPVQLGYVA